MIYRGKNGETVAGVILIWKLLPVTKGFLIKVLHNFYGGQGPRKNGAEGDAQ
jgi:hypothetical protein